MPIAFVPPLPGAGNFVVEPLVIVVPFEAIGLVSKQRFEERCGRKVLIVGDWLRDERLQIELFTARFQCLPVFVPGMAATPVFFGVNERDERHERGQAKEKSTNGAPVE